jgi:hypothetical protein
MHLAREPPTCCHVCGADWQSAFLSTDSRLAKGADAAAVIDAAISGLAEQSLSGGNDLGAEDDFGVVGGGQFA